MIAPSLGGSVASLDFKGKSVLRRLDAQKTSDPLAFASIILAPFSNRIRGGSFLSDGIRHYVPRNISKQKFPLHGNAFQNPWSVVNCAINSVTMTLENAEMGPFVYNACQTLELSADAVTFSLKVTNTGAFSLPFGCGFHPWFPRDSETKLRFNAGGVWVNDVEGLPTAYVSLDEYQNWDFSKCLSLPGEAINNCFRDWDRQALIIQGKRFVSVRIEASQLLGTAALYAPGKDAEFFCFEPVSHPTDAFNLAGQPGLVWLKPQESMIVSMKLHWGKSLCSDLPRSIGE